MSVVCTRMGRELRTAQAFTQTATVNVRIPDAALESFHRALRTGLRHLGDDDGPRHPHYFVVFADIFVGTLDRESVVISIVLIQIG